MCVALHRKRKGQAWTAPAACGALGFIGLLFAVIAAAAMTVAIHRGLSDFVVTSGKGDRGLLGALPPVVSVLIVIAGTALLLVLVWWWTSESMSLI